ncbi:hypothetical protein [Neotabrizicola sp. VNH66]|uniref:hypothetical protein n=1 Tax=Neotabrizicola sp. VNH66 TaxID=3400918 RepID=UPI003C0F1814
MDMPLDLPGPYDVGPEEAPWFLHAEPEEASPLPRAPAGGLIEAGEWRLAEAALAANLAALAFDAGRLAERLAGSGPGAVQRLAQDEAAALSWWTGDRIGAERLALWTSYRIGAAEEDGGAVIRTAWAARRLAAASPRGVRAAVADLLGAEGRGDLDLAEEVAAAIRGVEDMSAVTQGCALFHLWRSLDERQEHLRGLEAAVLGSRVAGQGRLPFLPLALTGFRALTASGRPEPRLRAWAQGAHGAVLAGAHVAGAAGRVAGAGSGGDGGPERAHARPANRGAGRPADAGGGRGRGRDGCQPRGGAAQPGSTGRSRPGARGHRAGPIPHLGDKNVRKAGRGSQMSYCTKGRQPGRTPQPCATRVSNGR